MSGLTLTFCKQMNADSTIFCKRIHKTDIEGHSRSTDFFAEKINGAEKK